MLEEQILQFQRVDDAGPLAFAVRRVVCAGFSGRSHEAVQSHVRELMEIGMPAPATTPMFFQVSPYLATTATGITVQDRLTSGEVECALIFDGREVYVTCGSDHTHRELEKHSIAGAKQMHPKVLAPDVWLFSEVEPYWDQLVLRSWSTLNGVRRLYQEAAAAEIMEPGRLLEEGERHLDMRSAGTVFMSGTIPTLGGLEYADRLDFELHDPVRNRTIRHWYDVVLMQ